MAIPERLNPTQRIQRSAEQLTDVKERRDMPFIHFVKSREGVRLAKIITEEFIPEDEIAVIENADFIVRPLPRGRDRLREDYEILVHDQEEKVFKRIDIIKSSGWKDRSWRHVSFHSLMTRRIKTANRRLGIIPSGNILHSIILPVRNP